MNPSDAEEFGLLSTCAFRFNGLSFLRDHPDFDAGESLSRLIAGDWPATHYERLALFFLLRFCWCEPRNGNHWKAFRELFLDLCHREVPAEYASEPHCEEWEHFYQQQLPAWVEFVRERHDATDYPLVAGGVN